MNKTLPEQMNAVNPAKLAAMVRRLNAALEAREQFEYAKSPNGSHIELRRAASYLRDNKTLAAFLVVNEVDPNNLLNRSRKAGYRANLKGVQKIKTLVDYITGKSKRFERVSLALFASAIIAKMRGVEWLSNAEQELILSNIEVGSLPAEVRDAIREYQHKYLQVEGDSRNQACQFRTTFDNLGAFEFSREDCEDFNRLGISVVDSSPIIQFLSSKWELSKAA